MSVKSLREAPVERNVEENDIPNKLFTAYELAKRSPDTSTKLGALIVDKGWNIAHGFNDLVPGYGDDKAHYERPFKYWVTEHAERAAIFFAIRAGFNPVGKTMVAPWVACPDCARAIVLSGIVEVICHKECMDRTPERWKEMVDTGLQILEKGGVTVVQWSGHLGIENFNNGEMWTA